MITAAKEAGYADCDGLNLEAGIVSSADFPNTDTLHLNYSQGQVQVLVTENRTLRNTLSVKFDQEGRPHAIESVIYDGSRGLGLTDTTNKVSGYTIKGRKTFPVDGYLGEELTLNLDPETGKLLNATVQKKRKKQRVHRDGNQVQRML